MKEKACLNYLDQAAALLEKMRTAMKDNPPDAAVNFLTASQEVAEILGKAIVEGMQVITEKQSKK